MTQEAIVDAVQANESVKITQAANQAIGNLTFVPLGKRLTLEEIRTVLNRVHGETVTGKNDGTRVYLHYKSFGKPLPDAIKAASRALEMGIPFDRYTGRVNRVWKTKDNDLCLTMLVELERDHMFRTFNLDKGTVYSLVVLGD